MAPLTHILSHVFHKWEEKYTKERKTFSYKSQKQDMCVFVNQIPNTTTMRKPTCFRVCVQ